MFTRLHFHELVHHHNLNNLNTFKCLTLELFLKTIELIVLVIIGLAVKIWFVCKTCILYILSK